MTRTELYSLIDTLPESKLPVARAYLEGLRDGTRTEKQRFMADIQDGLDELERGQRVPHEEVDAEIETWLQS